MQNNILLIFIIFCFFLPTCSYADITTGLVGWWKLNEGTTGASVIDSSGKGNTGTESNSPPYVAGNRQPFAMSFNGTNQVVTISNSSSLAIANPISFSAWVYLTSYNLSNSTNGFIAGIVSKYNSNNDDEYFFRLAGNSGHTVAFLACGGSAVLTASTDSIPLNTWTFVAATVDGSANATLYYNGSTITSGAVAINTGTDVVKIGQDFSSNNSRFFPGYIDDVRVYNRALSAQDVLTLYTGGNHISNGVIKNLQTNY